MALIPPDYMNAVVAIGNRNNDGTVQWLASGFFYGRFRRRTGENTAEYGSYLITNKHVLAGLTDPVIRANPVGLAPAQELPLRLVDDLGNSVWLGHPSPDVDVIATRVDIESLRALGLQMSFFADVDAASVEKMHDSGMSEGDDLFVLGFPMGLVGGPRSAVLVRSATLAQFQAIVDGAAASYIIDGYVFPGNSGGPVLSRPGIISVGGTRPVGNAYLVGIVASYIPYLDVAVSAQTGRNRIVFEENSGLSNVFPVNSIEDVIDLWDATHPLPAPDGPSWTPPDDSQEHP